MVNLLVACLMLATSVSTDLTFEVLDEAYDTQNEDVVTENLMEVLSEWHGRPTKVRGFLYRLTEGEYVLCSQPDLDTCCVGAADNMRRQLVVHGLEEEFDQGTAVTLCGDFFVDMKSDKQGSVRQVYRLDHARMVPHRTVPWIALLSGCVVACLAASWAVTRRKRAAR